MTKVQIVEAAEHPDSYEVALQSKASEVDQLVAWASSLVITNNEEMAAAAAKVKLIDEFYTGLEGEKEFYYRPLKQQCDAITKKFREPLDKLELAKRQGRQALAKYNDGVLQEARRQQEAARKLEQDAALAAAAEREALVKAEQDKIAAKAAGRAEELRAAGQGDVAAAVEAQAATAQVAIAAAAERVTEKEFKAADKVEKVAQTVTVGGIKLTTGYVDKWRVLDLNAVPRAYMVLDEVAVTKAMRAGTPVPGIEYYQEAQTSVK